MNREIPGEVAMRFQVRDLMSNVFPMQFADNPCAMASTGGQCLPPPCPPPSCQGQSGCPNPSQKPPKIAREMLSVLRDQMRQALVPA